MITTKRADNAHERASDDEHQAAPRFVRLRVSVSEAEILRNFAVGSKSARIEDVRAILRRAL